MGAIYENAKTEILNQFLGSPNLLKFLEILLDRLEDAKSVLEYIRDNVNLDDAEGVWLDLIGEIIGLQRPYKEQDPKTIFTIKNLGEPDDPFMAVRDPVTGHGGYIQTAEGLTDLADPTAKETDPNYRRLLRAKTFATNAIGTISDIYLYLKNGFEARSTYDFPQTGLVQITLDNWLSQRERNHVKDFGPILAGVAIEFLNWPPAL